MPIFVDGLHFLDKIEHIFYNNSVRNQNLNNPIFSQNNPISLAIQTGKFLHYLQELPKDQYALFRARTKQLTDCFYLFLENNSHQYLYC